MVRMKMLVPVYLLFLAGVWPALAGTPSHEDELRKKLFADYNKLSLPDEFFHVSIGFTVLGIDLDEVRETMNLETWVKYQWTDKRLGWNSAEYPSISRLATPPSEIWMPDITVYNNARMSEINHITNPLALIYPTGNVLTVPTAIIPAMCVFDMTYWPHDIQNCTAKLGSWVFSGHHFNLTKFPSGNVLDFDIGQANGTSKEVTKGHIRIKESNVVFHSKYYDCCPEPYMSVEIHLLLERDAPAYNWLVKAPTIMLAIMTAVLFLLPPGSSEKATIGTILLFMNLVFLLSVTRMVEHSPSHTPLIVKFLSEQLIIVMVAVIVSVLVIRCVRSPHSDSLPRWLLNIVSALQAPMCVSGYYSAATTSSNGYHSKVSKDLAEDQAIVGEQTGENQPFAGEWILLGAILDRLLLMLYLTIFFIRLASYSAIF